MRTKSEEKETNLDETIDLYNEVLAAHKEIAELSTDPQDRFAFLYQGFQLVSKALEISQIKS